MKDIKHFWDFSDKTIEILHRVLTDGVLTCTKIGYKGADHIDYFYYCGDWTLVDSDYNSCFRKDYPIEEFADFSLIEMGRSSCNNQIGTDGNSLQHS